MKLDGAERIVYNFKGTPDGYRPVVGLVSLDDRMYGVTRTGEVYNNRCVYEVRANGVERVLYSFTGGRNDGRVPEAELTAFNHALYGTASGADRGMPGSFLSSPKTVPNVCSTSSLGVMVASRARLTAMNDKLYGTTEFGGSARAGTVF